MSRAATVKTGEWTQLLLTAGAGAFPVVVGRTAAGFVGAILTMALDIAIGAIFPRVHAAKLAGLCWSYLFSAPPSFHPLPGLSVCGRCPSRYFFPSLWCGSDSHFAESAKQTHAESLLPLMRRDVSSLESSPSFLHWGALLVVCDY